MHFNHQARVVLFRGGNLQKELVFQASEKGPSNWYSAATLINSSWSDLKTETTNFFSFERVCGSLYVNETGCRSFVINRQGDDCHDADGWIMLPDGPWCAWNRTSFPINHIIYSKEDTYAQWSDESESRAKCCCIYRCFSFQKFLDVKLVKGVLNNSCLERGNC